jgi:hypothetical protein
MFYRAAVQIAQILLPQYDEFGGPKPTIIPVGIDQHPYILLARDIAEKKGFIPPTFKNIISYPDNLDFYNRVFLFKPYIEEFLKEGYSIEINSEKN